MSTTAPVTPPVGQPHGTPATAALRSVEGIHKSTTFHWVGNGFFVSTYFPSDELPAERVSPFVLMDYGPPQGVRARSRAASAASAGIRTAASRPSPSPGRARSRTATTPGNAGVIGPGDVQWMTAGAGIFHEEYHEEEFTRRGGRMHMMQLWVNLPAEGQDGAARLPAHHRGRHPERAARRAAATVRVIAGEYDGRARSGPHVHAHHDARRRSSPAGARLPVTLPGELQRAGRRRQGARPRRGAHGERGRARALRERRRRASSSSAREDAHVILLSGEPLDEPVVQYGPFVMNTVQEIEQAIVDVNSGKFGPVPD